MCAWFFSYGGADYSGHSHHFLTPSKKKILLCGQQVDFDVGDYDGRTALHLAAAENQVDAVAWLVGHVNNLSPRDRWGQTPAEEVCHHH